MNKLSKKKICGSCRALNPADGTCELGFKIKTTQGVFDIPVYHPKEPCSKPLTSKAYNAELNDKGY